MDLHFQIPEARLPLPCRSAAHQLPTLPRHLRLWQRYPHRQYLLLSPASLPGKPKSAFPPLPKGVCFFRFLFPARRIGWHISFRTYILQRAMPYTASASFCRSVCYSDTILPSPLRSSYSLHSLTRTSFLSHSSLSRPTCWHVLPDDLPVWLRWLVYYFSPRRLPHTDMKHLDFQEYRSPRHLRAATDTDG